MVISAFSSPPPPLPPFLLCYTFSPPHHQNPFPFTLNNHKPRTPLCPIFTISTNSSATNADITTDISIGGGNGGIGGGSNSGGGGGGGDDNGNNWNADSNKKKNRDEALMALAEAGKGLENLPKDLKAAVEDGRIPGSIVSRYFELEKSGLTSWFMKFDGFKERLLADDLFLAKVAMECGVGVFTKVIHFN